MAGTATIPEEVKEQMTAAVGEATVDPYAALEGRNEHVSAPVVVEPVDKTVDKPAEAPAEPPVETPAPAGSPVISHSPELIERATALMIPADEVAAMSPAELQRVIRHADRVGQTVYNELSKKLPPEQPVVPAAAEPDALAVLNDPEKYDQAFVAPIKEVLTKQARENKDLRERLEKIEKLQANTHQQQLHTRLMTGLEPEIAKVFDLSTPAGKAKYDELLDQMGAIQRHNKKLGETQLRARAIKGMDLVPEKPKEAPETVASKRRWDNAALSDQSGRSVPEDLGSKIDRILQEGARNTQRSPKPNGQGVPH